MKDQTSHHISPHWPSYLPMPLGALISLCALIATGGSPVIYAALALFLLGSWWQCQSISVTPEGLILRLLWIPIRRIPWPEVSGVILHPAHRGRKGHYVPPMILAILTPGTIAQYAEAKNRDPYCRPDCSTVSAQFTERQEDQVREFLEQYGCTVVDYEDVIYHEL